MKTKTNKSPEQMIQNSYCESTDDSGTERKQEYERKWKSVLRVA